MRPKLDLAAEMRRAFVDEPAEQLASAPPDLAVIEAIHSGLERMWRDAHAAFVIAERERRRREQNIAFSHSEAQRYERMVAEASRGLHLLD